VPGARRRHVTCEHRNRGFVDLGAQLVDHRLGQLDPGHGHTPRGKRYRHSAGADRELQRTAAGCKVCEAGDRGAEYIRREHAGAGGVVALSGRAVPHCLLRQTVDVHDLDHVAAGRTASTE